MTTEGATNRGWWGVILKIPRAKKHPSANLTSRADPLNSFDWQAPAFPRWVFPMDFPVSDPIFLEQSVMSIYPKVAAISPMGGVAGRLRAKKSQWGKGIKMKLGFNPSPLGRLRATPGLDMDEVNGGGAGG